MANERRGLAYHEAGHAAVACALGLRVIEVSIDMDGSGSNHTRLDPNTPPSLPQALIIGDTVAGHGAREGRLERIGLASTALTPQKLPKISGPLFNF